MKTNMSPASSLPRIAFSLLVALCFVAAEVPAFDTSNIEDPDVRACAERSIPESTLSQTQLVRVTGANGFVRESIRELYWKRFSNDDSRVLVRVVEPPDEKGLAVLINDYDLDEPNYAMYSPRLKRVRRVTGESFFGSVLGTDFTYEDFAHFYRVDEREKVKRVDDGNVDGHPAYILETIKQDDNASYDVVRFYVDKALCMPVRADFIAPNGSLRKQLLVERDEIKLVDERWIPYVTTMVDYKLNTHTEFVVQEVSVDPDLREGLFNFSELMRSN